MSNRSTDFQGIAPVDRRKQEGDNVKATKYRATFPNGTVIVRSSSRPFSHAWLVIYALTPAGVERLRRAYARTRAGQQSLVKGFSRTEDLARKALAMAVPDDPDCFTVEFQGVVPVEVV